MCERFTTDQSMPLLHTYSFSFLYSDDISEAIENLNIPKNSCKRHIIFNVHGDRLDTSQMFVKPLSNRENQCLVL
jgi:hypothetical protein